MLNAPNLVIWKSGSRRPSEGAKNIAEKKISSLTDNERIINSLTIMKEAQNGNAKCASLC
ncbi:hypothetical protein Csa_020804 [Cucumis sativus]|nr:hypothetical protein Csa_020804 [Cucumis sativus]